MTKIINKIKRKTEKKLSNWVTLITKEVEFEKQKKIEVYHSLSLFDYVTVIAYTNEKKICIVRQFRPARENFTYELPGGLRENNITPEETIRNELYEETGLKPLGAFKLLGKLSSDTGRLENNLFAFAVKVQSVPEKSWLKEKGIKSFLLDIDTLFEWIIDGKFNHALHIAVIGLARLHKII